MHALYTTYMYKGIKFHIICSFPRVHTKGIVGDYPKVSAPGVRLLQPLCDKSPPLPGWGGGGGGGGGGGSGALH